MYDLPELPPRLFHVPLPDVDSYGSEVQAVVAYDWLRHRARVVTGRHTRHAEGYWVLFKHLEVRDF